MGYPAPVGRRTLRRVARAAEDGSVRDVERRTASGERHDVIDGQVGGRMSRASVSRAPVATLTAPGAEHAGAESLPGPRAVDGVVPAAVGLAGVRGAAASSAAGDDTTDRAELHPRIVGGVAGGVHTLAVLRPGGQSHHRLWQHRTVPGTEQRGAGVTARTYFVANRVWWAGALFLAPIVAAIVGTPVAGIVAAGILVLPAFVLFDTDRGWWSNEVRVLPQDKERSRTESL
jgi:hypothetical protein